MGDISWDAYELVHLVDYYCRSSGGSAFSEINLKNLSDVYRTRLRKAKIEIKEETRDSNSIREKLKEVQSVFDNEFNSSTPTEGLLQVIRLYKTNRSLFDSILSLFDKGERNCLSNKNHFELWMKSQFFDPLECEMFSQEVISAYYYTKVKRYSVLSLFEITDKKKICDFLVNMKKDGASELEIDGLEIYMTYLKYLHEVNEITHKETMVGLAPKKNLEGCELILDANVLRKNTSFDINDFLSNKQNDSKKAVKNSVIKKEKKPSIKQEFPQLSGTKLKVQKMLRKMTKLQSK